MSFAYVDTTPILYRPPFQCETAEKLEQNWRACPVTPGVIKQFEQANILYLAYQDHLMTCPVCGGKVNGA